MYTQRLQILPILPLWHACKWGTNLWTNRSIYKEWRIGYISQFTAQYREEYWSGQRKGYGTEERRLGCTQFLWYLQWPKLWPHSVTSVRPGWSPDWCSSSDSPPSQWLDVSLISYLYISLPYIDLNWCYLNNHTFRTRDKVTKFGLSFSMAE